MFFRNYFGLTAIALLVSAVFLFSPGKIFAQIESAPARSYHYPFIDFSIFINEDSTVLVEEWDTYEFKGEYHQGWRSLVLNKVDDITDIMVLDGRTEQPLRYSPKRLDKLASGSWGAYTVYEKDGAKNIEWYFDTRDTQHSWIIRYKLHGSISFLKDHDEFYWNLFTDFSVPVDVVLAEVHLPRVAGDGPLQAAIYRTNHKGLKGYDIIDRKSFIFQAEALAPNEKLTIAAGWPKSIVSHEAYWEYFLNNNKFLILGLLLFISTIIWRILFWYFKEKRPEQSQTVVPEYEPPQKLKPAMAEIIVKEKITFKGWSATVVDLAVRGYLKVREEKQNIYGKGSKVLFQLFSTAVWVMFAFVIFSGMYDILYDVGFHLSPAAKLFLLWGLIIGVLFLSAKNFKKSFSARSYRLERGPRNYDQGLEQYETEFLNEILFKGRNYFSAKELRKDPQRSVYMAKAMETMQRNLYKETVQDTDAYEVKLPDSKKYEKYIRTIPVVLIFIVAFIALSPVLQGAFDGAIIFVAIVILSAYVIMRGIKNARLNAQGRILKKEWLGFKLYLETAERYRMRNLKPETFEKYLPYAIIFGIEKKWARAFDGLNLLAPSWYSGSVGGSSGSSSFSPTAFSSSFSASFASSFGFGGSGLGGSGGGGGAGGGGGGGGGGAS